MKRSGLLLLPLALLTTDLGWSQTQIQTRRQQLEILRRDKVARLWPERQSQIALLVNRYTTRGWLQDPSQGPTGFQPVVLGGMRSDNGFTYGIGYRRTDLFRDRLGFRVTARATAQESTLFDFYVESPKLNRKEKSSLDFYAKYENSPRMSYYGQGQDSLKENRTSYRLEDTDLSVTGGYWLSDWFKISGRAGGYFVHIGEGTREPSIDEGFPGLRQDAKYFHWSGEAQVDYRDNPAGPRSGGNYWIRFRQYRDGTREQHSFHRIHAFAEQYFPYYNKTRVVALRVEGMMAFSGTDQSVPFYLQPYLGGNNRLRGFEPYRFTDQTAFFAVAEHRWYVFSGLEAGLFAETGKVAPRNGTLNLSNLKWDGGLSLRFKLFDSFLMRVDNAFSSEGWRFIWTFSELFGRTDRW